MQRQQWIEIHEQPWCPTTLRNGLTDALQFGIHVGYVYQPIVPLLKEALQRTQAKRIIDLCAGGGGPWQRILQQWQQEGFAMEICLTDKFPNIPAWQHLQDKSNGALTYYPEEVNALHVPSDLSGFRTLFSSFHHFPPDMAQAILADAFHQRQGIGIFEASFRNIPSMIKLGMSSVFSPFIIPLISPFRWSRLLWTLPIPVLPLIMGLDGVVSCFRTYSEEELRQMISNLQAPDYTWECGVIHHSMFKMPVTYLIGRPDRKSVV